MDPKLPGKPDTSDAPIPITRDGAEVAWLLVSANPDTSNEAIPATFTDKARQFFARRPYSAAWVAVWAVASSGYLLIGGHL